MRNIFLCNLLTLYAEYSLLCAEITLTESRNQSPMVFLWSQASSLALRSTRKDSWWDRICGIWKKMSSTRTLLTIWFALSWWLFSGL